MESLSIRLELLLNKVDDKSLKVQEINAIKKMSLTKLSRKTIFFISLGIVLLIAYRVSDYFTDPECLVEMPHSIQLSFRPIEPCDFCQNIKEITSLINISPEQFESKYAYSGAPIIVKDATLNWTAHEIFSFEYFRDLYLDAFEDHHSSQVNCQFFPYKTEFKTLQEAFQMDDARAKYEKGTKPWYFGWSNCDQEIAQILRQHYGRPYFLPKLSENNAVDWIFMGGSGNGANMHLDNVRLPSWQAQIRGTKEWILAPPPECTYECSWFKATVQKGDTIVLDTNKWFHKTNVLEGELSITIGAEYD